MRSPDAATGSHHDPLDAVIAAYLQQVEAGAVPDREALLAQHPELAEGLREFFADFDRLDRQAGELHLSDTATEPAGERPHVPYFGEYELLEVIARGGMGVVYEARQQSLNRLVALKMILQGQLATPRAVARFRAEAEAAANLDHPRIVPIHEVGEHEGQQYFTMRFIEGTSLARHPRGDLRSEVRLLATVTRAVHYAHQHGLLHRHRGGTEGTRPRGQWATFARNSSQRAQIPRVCWSADAEGHKLFGSVRRKIGAHAQQDAP